MRVNVVKTIVYTFTFAEHEYLKDMGIWSIIQDRLHANERIEIEQS